MMRSEASIREHIRNLLTCQKLPCECKGTLHEFECFCGAKMMVAVIMNLKWVLGDGTIDDQIERMAKLASEARMEGFP